jgi:hypothetical protein
MFNSVLIWKLYSIGLLYCNFMHLELSKEVGYEVYCKLLPQPTCTIMSRPLSNTLRSHIDAERFYQPTCFLKNTQNILHGQNMDISLYHNVSQSKTPDFMTKLSCQPLFSLQPLIHSVCVGSISDTFNMTYGYSRPYTINNSQAVTWNYA